MTSKRSFWVSVRTNARRRVWLAVVMLLGFFFALPVSVGMRLSVDKMSYRYQDLHEYLGREFSAMIGMGDVAFLIAVFAVVAAVQGFSYMYQRKKLDLYMSVPVTKGHRFWSIYLNGILIYLILYLCNMLLSFLVAGAMGAAVELAVRDAALALLAHSLLFLAVYHVTILAVMLTGNLLVTLMGTGVLLFFDGAVYILLCAYMEAFETYCYKSMEAYQSLLVSPILRFVRLLDESYEFVGRSPSWIRVLDLGAFFSGILTLAAAGILALALAYWCYTKKPAEACGRSMAFPVTKAPIKVAITVFAGLFAGIMFYDLSNRSLFFFIFGLAAGTLLCHGTIEVIYDFDIRSMKNGWKSLLVSAGIVAALFSVFRFDLLHYDRYVPKPEQVESVAFWFADASNQYYDENLDGENREKYLSEHMQIVDIEPILELAQRRMGMDLSEAGGAAQNAGAAQEENLDLRWVIVRYQLKNGRTVWRQFPTLYREDARLLDRIVTDRAYREALYPIYNETEMALGDKFTVYYDGGSGRETVHDLSVKKLTEGYRRDLEGFTFTQEMNDRILGMFYLECLENGDMIRLALPVYPSFANTIELIREKGLYQDRYVDLDEVEKIVVQNSNSDAYDTYMQAQGSGSDADIQDFTVEAAFEDREEMSRILDAVYPTGFDYVWMPEDTLNYDYRVTLVYKSAAGGKERSEEYFLIADQIPDFVAEKTAYRG